MRVVRGIFGLFLVLGLCLAAPVGAQNLLSNPNFDDELAPWLATFNSTAEFSTKDVTSSSSSGSAHTENDADASGTSAGIYSPCRLLPPGTTFTAGASFWLPSGQNRTGKPQVLVAWYSAAGCPHGNFISQPFVQGPATLDSWVTVSKAFTPPHAAVAFSLALYFVKNEPAGAIEGYIDNAFFAAGDLLSPCVAEAQTLCLHGNRFKVRADWRSTSEHGTGNGTELNDDTGYFYFFSPNNTEVIVKVVSACVDPFDSYWVFAAGLTDVEVTITVTDTQTGAVRTYINPLHTPFAPIQDTSAFATCP